MRSRIVGLSMVLTASVGGGLLPSDTAAQSTKPPARIGWLTPDRRPTNLAGFATAFRQALAGLGHVEHRSYVMEYRFADSDGSRYSALAAELVRLPVDLIVTASTPATRAAKAVTTTVPIVFKVSADPVERGLVASLARPGGNLTGFFLGTYDDKGLEALKECVPKLSRVGWLSTDSNSERTKAAEISQYLGVKIMYLPVDGPADLTQALAAAAGGGLDGLYVVALG